jgi:hypothetical protein
MNLFTASVVSVALVFTTLAAKAQSAPPSEPGRPGYAGASDLGGPRGTLPPQAPEPAYGQGPAYGAPPPYGPPLLPPGEVYLALRRSGFVPLAPPRQRGMFYVIAVSDRHGEDGRLVVDGRTGRIVRFVPAYGMGYGPYGPYGAMPMPYPPGGRLPPVAEFGEPPRPPATVPKVASRTMPVPIPKAAPPRSLDDDKPLAEKPQVQSQQSAAMQVRPAEPPAAQAAPPAEAKPPAPPILPTQPMPQVQGLE